MSETCIVCLGKNLKTAQTFPSYSVVECQDCQFGRVSPLPTSGQLDALYNSPEYFATHMKYDFDNISDEKIMEIISNRKSLHRQDLNGLERNCRTMLEIGCGGGFSLKAFEAMSMNATGIETSKPASDFARTRLNVNVLNISFEAVDVQKKYDLVLLNHVLEHLIDPIASFKKLSNLVAPGGILYIRVPDHDSFDRRAYGSDWPAYAQYHVSNFSEKSLSLLFQKNEFKSTQKRFFVSQKASKLIQKLAKGPFKKVLSKRYNGRTISMIGVKQK